MNAGQTFDSNSNINKLEIAGRKCKCLLRDFSRLSDNISRPAADQECDQTTKSRALAASRPQLWSALSYANRGGVESCADVRLCHCSAAHHPTVSTLHLTTRKWSPTSPPVHQSTIPAHQPTSPPAHQSINLPPTSPPAYIPAHYSNSLGIVVIAHQPL